MKRPRTIRDAFALTPPLPPYATALAQPPGGGGGNNNSAKRFARDGFVFHYTGVWTLADRCAARGSIYTQTSLCAKHAPVTGAITDNFVYQR